jgi:methyl-accepting chemotaxis protein
MNRIKIILSSVSSLGVFGLILLLITLVVVLTWISYGSVEQPFETVQSDLIKLNFLEDEVSFYLLELDLNADYYDFSWGDPEYVEAYDENDQYIRETLLDIEFEIHDDNVEEFEYLESMLGFIDAHNQAFLDLQSAVDADDPSAIKAAQASLAEGATQADTLITDWVFYIESSLTQATREGDARTRTTFFVGVFGLIALPLLAYWAFMMTGQITRPILTLTNAVIAIQGKHFRPEMLNDIAERRDNLGQLALDLEVMSDELSSRRQALENELNDLQTKIKDERRRKRM